MTATEAKSLSFITDEGFRLRISLKKAGNSFVLEAALLALKNDGYTFYRLFEGGYIYAEKEA